MASFCPIQRHLPLVQHREVLSCVSAGVEVSACVFISQIVCVRFSVLICLCVGLCVCLCQWFNRGRYIPLNMSANYESTIINTK